MFNYPKNKLVLGMLLALVAGFVVPSFLGLVANLGHGIPQPHIEKDYLTGLIWAIILAVSIIFWPVPSRYKPYLLLLWTAKVIVTLFLMLFYEDRYGLDSYYYFEVGVQRDFYWQGFKFGDGTRNMFHFVRLHQYLIPNSYHALKISFAMIGLLGIYFFYRAVIFFLQRDNLKLLLAIGLFPSILFWSSILGKDPIVFFGISLYAYGTAGLVASRKLHYVPILVAGILLSVLMRIWLGPILLAPLLVFILVGIKSPILKTLFIAIAVMGFLASLSQLTAQFNVETSQDLISTTDTISKSWAYGGSGHKSEAFTSLPTMIAFMPIGAFTALFRPLPGEILNPFGMLSGLENAFLLRLLWLSMRRTRLRELKHPVLLWAISLILTWSMLYGFVSFQNLGTAVRFRLQILPVLLCVLLYLSRARNEGGAAKAALPTI